MWQDSDIPYNKDLYDWCPRSGAALASSATSPLLLVGSDPVRERSCIILAPLLVLAAGVAAAQPTTVQVSPVSGSPAQHLGAERRCP